MTDQRIENVLGNLLRISVGLSATIVFCGFIIYLASTSCRFLSYSKASLTYSLRYRA